MPAQKGKGGIGRGRVKKTNVRGRAKESSTPKRGKEKVLSPRKKKETLLERDKGEEPEQKGREAGKEGHLGGRGRMLSCLQIQQKKTSIVGGA